MATETASYLRSRWRSEPFLSRSRDICHALKQNRDLADVKGLEKHNELWDLRGFAFHQVKSSSWFELGNWTIERQKGAQTFSGAILQDVDLEYASLDGSLWERCTFAGVRLTNTSIRNAGFWQCVLNNTTFKKSDLRDTCVDGNIGNKACQYSQVDFHHADMRGTVYTFGSFLECDFSRAKLDEVDFEGASFIDCKFSGHLESVIFRKHSRIANKGISIVRRIDPKEHESVLRNVDFTQCTRLDVEFIDLSVDQCMFPSVPNILIVNNPRHVFSLVRKTIADSWEGEQRDIALRYLDSYFLDETRGDKEVEIIQKDLESETMGEEFAMRFFDLVRQVGTSRN